jgi:cytochrome c
MRWIVTGVLVVLVAGSALAYTAEQAERGAQVYAEHCAVCHGGRAEGGQVPAQFERLAGWTAPPLVGDKALPRKPRQGQSLRQGLFRSAYDLLSFVEATMPAQEPAGLRTEQYQDVTAYILQAGGLPPDGHPLDEAQAARIKLSRLKGN